MKITLCILSLYIKILLSSGSFLRRFSFNGILYPYSATPWENIMFIMTEDAEWKNLSQLILNNNMTDKQMFCTAGNGAWLAYPEVDFQHGSNTYFTIMIGEECIPAQNLQSVQPLGFLNKKLESALFTFTSSYFTSEAKVHEEKSTSGDIKSLFSYGGKNWTIEGPGEKGTVKLCLSRGSPMLKNETYCAIPDVEAQFGITGSVTINEGCEESNSTPIYTLQTCYDEGVNKVNVEMALTIKNVTSICKNSMDSTEKNLMNKFVRIMELWNSRIKGQLMEDNSKIEPDPDSADAKTHLFRKIIEVFQMKCPSLSPGYVDLLADVFYIHLREMWKMHPEHVPIKGDRWQDVEHYLMTCATNMGMGGGDGLRLMERDLEEMREDPDLRNPTFVAYSLENDDDMPSDGDFKRKKRRRKRQIDPDPDMGSDASCNEDMDSMDSEMDGDNFHMMMMGELYGFDEVIEQMWLIFNFVNPYCSYTNAYSDNYWTYSSNLLMKAYLTPLFKQWHYPGKWSEFYPNIFNGYAMASEKKRILSCIQGLMHLIPNFEPMIRPMDLFENEKNSMDGSQDDQTDSPSPAPAPSPAPPPPSPPPPPPDRKDTKANGTDGVDSDDKNAEGPQQGRRMFSRISASQRQKQRSRHKHSNRSKISGRLYDTDADTSSENSSSIEEEIQGSTFGFNTVQDTNSTSSDDEVNGTSQQGRRMHNRGGHRKSKGRAFEKGNEIEGNGTQSERPGPDQSGNALQDITSKDEKNNTNSKVESEGSTDELTSDGDTENTITPNGRRMHSRIAAGQKKMYKKKKNLTTPKPAEEKSPYANSVVSTNVGGDITVNATVDYAPEYKNYTNPAVKKTDNEGFWLPAITSTEKPSDDLTNKKVVIPILPQGRNFINGDVSGNNITEDEDEKAIVPQGRRMFSRVSAGQKKMHKRKKVTPYQSPPTNKFNSQGGNRTGNGTDGSKKDNDVDIMFAKRNTDADNKLVTRDGHRARRDLEHAKAMRKGRKSKHGASVRDNDNSYELENSTLSGRRMFSRIAAVQKKMSKKRGYHSYKTTKRPHRQLAKEWDESLKAWDDLMAEFKKLEKPDKKESKKSEDSESRDIIAVRN